MCDKLKKILSKTQKIRLRHSCRCICYLVKAQMFIAKTICFIVYYYVKHDNLYCLWIYWISDGNSDLSSFICFFFLGWFVIDWTDVVYMQKNFIVWPHHVNFISCDCHFALRVMTLATTILFILNEINTYFDFPLRIFQEKTA